MNVTSNGKIILTAEEWEFISAALRRNPQPSPAPLKLLAEPSVLETDSHA